ncbi:hypothetical protein BDV11DRAFT_209995 [Aspergillus similis]
MADSNPTPSHPQPQRLTGVLSQFRYIESTSALGREYTDLQLSSILDNDEMVRDLAITVSERGVLLINNQNITPSELKRLVIHRHLDIPEVEDPEIFIISSVTQKKTLADALPSSGRKFASWGWHTDESYEKYPPAYTVFKIAKSPPTGGDTLFVSSYDGLTATHSAKEFLRFAEKGMPLNAELERGHPENVGLKFQTSHPVVRTNPVTGWKGLFGVGFGLLDGHFDNMTEHENSLLKEYSLRMITDSSDLQTRKRWNDNYVTIWDNLAALCITTQHSIEEKPYYDPSSTSRAEFLAGFPDYVGLYSEFAKPKCAGLLHFACIVSSPCVI